MFKLNELTLTTIMMSTNKESISIVLSTLSTMRNSKFSFEFSLDSHYFDSQNDNIELEFNIDESLKKRDLYTF